MKGGLAMFNVKYLSSENNVELWFFDEAVRTKKSDIDNIAESEIKKFEDCNLGEKIARLKRRKLYYQKQRHELRRLIDVNLIGDCSFVTLTFRDHIDDIVIANREFEKFIKRLKYYFEKVDSSFELKYLAVNERTKKNRVHYHVIFFNFPYINKSILEAVWKNGFVDIRLIRKNMKTKDGELVPRTNVALYISKYFAKQYELSDVNLKTGEIEDYNYKKKAFFKSTNLVKVEYSKELYCNDILEMMKNLIKEKSLHSSFYERLIPADNYKVTGELLPSGVSYFVVSKEDFLKLFK